MVAMNNGNSSNGDSMLKLRVMKAVRDEDRSYLGQLLGQNGDQALEIAILESIHQDSASMLQQILDHINNAYEEEDLRAKIGQILSEIEAKERSNILEIAIQNSAIDCCELLLTNQYLRQYCSPIEWSDNECTPLHMAVCSDDVALMRVLVEAGDGLDVASFEKERHTSLVEAAVKHGDHVNTLRYLLEECKADKMGANNAGFSETPLHICAELNHKECLQLLLESEVPVDCLRGKDVRETALHVAANNGDASFDCVSVLLQHNANVNARNIKGETPLHLAAKNLASNTIMTLLDHGADVDAQDRDGRPALHFAINSKLKGSSECLQILIERGGANLEIADNNGMTSLHLAALNRKLTRVQLLIRHGADLCAINKANRSALYFVMKHVPNGLRALEERLDAGLQTGHSNESILENVDYVKMNFNAIMPSSNHVSEVALFTELLQLHSHSSDQAKLERIFMHPLCMSFLHLKWNQVKWLYYSMALFSHFVYSVTYSIYCVLVFHTLCKPREELMLNETLANRIFGQEHQCLDWDTHYTFWLIARCAWLLLLAFNVLYVSKELTKVMYLGTGYFREWESVLNLLTILSFPLISILAPNNSPIIVYAWQFHAAGIGVLVTWVLMMFLIGKVPRFGKYVQMLINVGWNFLNFFVAYSSLFCGFSLAFTIFFPREVGFSQVLASPLKVLVMMTGEIEFDDLYYPRNENEIPFKHFFPVSAPIILALFVMVASVIIMNLLFGMAVSDVQELYKKSRLLQSIQQVRLISYMESTLTSPLFAKLPHLLQNVLVKRLHGGSKLRIGNVYEVKPDTYESNRRQTLPVHLNNSIKAKCREIRRRREDVSALVDLRQSVSELKLKLERLTTVLEQTVGPLVSHSSSSANLEELVNAMRRYSSINDMNNGANSPELVNGNKNKRESQASIFSGITLEHISEMEERESD